MQMDMRGRGTLGSLDTLAMRICRAHCALNGARETLVALRVVVLQANLEFDRLDELALLLAVRVRKELADGASHA